jgi:signal transduction histidine kinase/HAMP domain-containing protein/CheY-like chemotaxis protein
VATPTTTRAARPAANNGDGAGIAAEELAPLLEALCSATRGETGVRLDARKRGPVGALAKAFNDLAVMREKTTDEIVRVATAIGSEGRLTDRAETRGTHGVWNASLSAVNGMIDDLSRPTLEVARVIGAVAEGDLSQKMQLKIEGRAVKGEFLRIGTTVNAMVDQLSSFADEVTRVAREVGTEGTLGGQAEVKGVSGTWKDLTDNVNGMASNLTSQVRNIAEVTTAVANGDLTRKITVNVRGEVLELKNTINTMVDQLSIFADEVTRVAREVGTEGRLGGQANVRGVSGTWKDLTDNVNLMVRNLTDQVRNTADVTTAVAKGNLSQKIGVAAVGEFLALKTTINTMVDQLSSFADEVTRVAREVGTDGVLGGQADVKEVSGTWKDLTDSVNGLSSSLTTQVRNIADVTTAVANGDLSKKITVDVRGEVLELKDTINTMVDQLASFAAEVTRVAREVGTEGILGGQANVEGVSGVWRGLTDNVNTLAGTLTTQLRAIAEVTTAVTQGDLTRRIAVEAAGEVEELRDDINQMITTLRETTDVNAQQDWLNTNMARFSGLLQGQRDLKAVSRLVMSELTPLVGAQHGAFFMAEPAGLEPQLRLIGSYAFRRGKGAATTYSLGEGLVGQAAVERKSILVAQAPADYIAIASGLGEAAPVSIIVLPVLFEDQVMAVIELASFTPYSDTHLTFLEQLTETLGVVLNTIVATMRTEELLQQSQGLTLELQSQSEELQSQRDELERTNQELEEKAELLAEQNARIEQKNTEVETARVELEEKAEQLSLSSKYKSEFLANMSHELRTPLNSLLILAKLLSDNHEGTLSEKQIEFAKTIYNAGSDLLELINDILDLSKVEAGKTNINLQAVQPTALADYVQRNFSPVADQQELNFTVELADGLPATIVTDEQRLQQVLKNLLSNAFKFTEQGAVTLTISPAPADARFGQETLRTAQTVVQFAVADTGIGIPDEKLKLIFEAFQQADGTTSRRYGGTGLGLSISREIARLLGGEIHVESLPGEGSTFTLSLPLRAPEQERSYAETIAVKDVRSPERALSTEDVFKGKRVLIADDDMRNVFALASVLERQGMDVIFAENGNEAIASLRADPTIDLVLMDIMMPELDGYAAMRRIREQPQFAKLPIISLTAKAMKGDREKSIASGASDYITKPVDTDQLLSLMRAWLDR